jgi:two-component system sensor histidine kinase/response regulator
MMISKPLLRSTLISAFERALGEQRKQPACRSREFDFTGKRVLVAEDNDLNAEIAKTLLEASIFPWTGVNGLKALEKFVQSPTGTYDAILMDVRMPLMDGLQACRQHPPLGQARTRRRFPSSP